MAKKKYTNEQLLQILKKELDKNPYISVGEFSGIKGYPSRKTYDKRFESWNNAKIILGYDIIKKEYTNEELLNILQECCKGKFTTQHEFDLLTKGRPCSDTYRNRFGSWGNALNLINIEVPKEKKKLFQRRNNYDYIEIKDEFDILVELFLSDNIKLPPLRYFNNSDFLSETMLRRLYGNTKEVYLAMGYNHDEFNKKRLKEDIICKYLEIKDILNYLPNSKDINRFSLKNNDYYYNYSTYIKYFESLPDFQKHIGEIPTAIWKSISKEEIIECLYKLKNELGFIPTTVEINNCNYLPNVGFILNKLNYTGVGELQLALFGEKIERVLRITTENGTKCLSSYEYIIALILEEYSYNFTKDDMYRNYIKKLSSRHSVDFVIHQNNKYYFIEVFGMIGIPKYDEKTAWKIQLCKDNNIPLLELYPKDISITKTNELSERIANFVNQ